MAPCVRPLLSGPRVWPRLSVMLRAGEKAWTTSASSLSPRIWPTVRGWRARCKGFVSPDNVGKRRPSRPDRFQGFQLSLPGHGREGLRDSGRGGARVRECARVCPEMLRLPQPPGRGHPTFSGCLPKAIDSSEKKSITTLRAPAPTVRAQSSHHSFPESNFT